MRVTAGHVQSARSSMGQAHPDATCAALHGNYLILRLAVMKALLLPLLRWHPHRRPPLLPQMLGGHAKPARTLICPSFAHARFAALENLELHPRRCLRMASHTI